MSDGHAARETLEWDKRGRVLTAARTALYVFREKEEEEEEEKDRRQPTGGREREGQTTHLNGRTCNTGLRDRSRRHRAFGQSKNEIHIV